ncbi:MAG: hypothetical protein M3Z08_12135, partial [Chloroflexota bacterium]|nr:hypothetical protein [Chloroflexota bacterium]
HEPLQQITGELVRLTPDDLLAWEMHMRALRGLGRFEEAAEAIEHVLELDPHNARFWTIKADTLYRLARYRESARIANHAMQVDADYRPAQRLHEKAVRMMYQHKEKRK